MEFSRLLIRATNWVGDAVMCLPALRLIRRRFPDARISVLARPWVGDLYHRESFCDEVIPYAIGKGAAGWRERWQLARQIRLHQFDGAILFTNSFETAFFARLAGIPRRIGYDRDGRGPLLTDAIAVPKKGETPEAERFYYLELLRRAGIIESLPSEEPILLEGAEEAAAAGRRRFEQRNIALPVIGVSPGATNSRAKQWFPDRFAEATSLLSAATGATIVLFGSASERGLCEQVAALIRKEGHAACNLAGQTSLSEFIELASACLAYVTNDSGAMHIASASGVPTVAIFGPTNELATGPPGPRSVVVREPVDCMRCMYRDCPIDHRCMGLVTSGRVAQATLELLK